MTRSVGIVGAGLLGRILALALSAQGWEVTLFDRDTPDGKASCSYIGAGLLCPWTELDSAERLIFNLGQASLTLWPKILAQLTQPVFFQAQGSLVVAHQLDQGDLTHFERTLTQRMPDGTGMVRFQSEGITTLEPSLANRFQQGLYFPEEGQIDNRQLLQALGNTLEWRGIIWHAKCEVLSLTPHTLTTTTQETYGLDWVVDTRGLGAKSQFLGLRGVRGEILRLHAPEVNLTRPIRLIHPRYALYIAPREDGHYVIGATSIESEDVSPVSAQSAMELLSAAFTVHPGFAEARILEFGVQCRPALPDNQPRITMQPGLLAINGLYRHGFLITPKLTQLALDLLNGHPLEPQYETILEKRPHATTACH